jgi:hypothetical protein
MRDNLMKDHYGQWVAVVNGQVVSTGKKRGQVGYEAFLKTGSGVCFCAKVGFEDRILRFRQVASGYFDLDYDPSLPKAKILISDLRKSASESVDFLIDK